MIESTIKSWHSMLASRDLTRLETLLAADVVFHSPVLHTPQSGKELVTFYLTAASNVLINNHFTYVREVISGDDAVLEFTTEIDGIYINGVDMIRCDETGQITDFKVMVRPLKAINLLHAKMNAMLEMFVSKQKKA